MRPETLAYLGFLLQVFVGFVAIMNPIGNTPIYLSLVEDFSEAERLRVARTAVLWAFFIVTVFTLGGNLIFRLFGITLPAFRIAGGILLFMIAYHLVRARRSHQHHPTEEEEEESPEDIAVTPLATPILAGPGTITTALSLVGRKTDPVKILTVIGVFGLVCLLTYLCFVYGEALTKRLRPYWVGVMTRLMGLILAVIAVQMVLEGLSEVLPQMFIK
ncbi:NAAT family transporter [Thermosulfurimonas marina]|uniref:UPF0056 membrane protein n=1 Tax=Thermosulfurimonas marina TaxID=2047767 RepID=A0A6H1WQN1_9BACT|nr:MarC family protein [Thermosulfurimonas marina]QJA05501.1 NAAT family transporter [Thermosulfurimonas marina]